MEDKIGVETIQTTASSINIHGGLSILKKEIPYPSNMLLNAEKSKKNESVNSRLKDPTFISSYILPHRHIKTENSKDDFDVTVKIEPEDIVKVEEPETSFLQDTFTENTEYPNTIFFPLIDPEISNPLCNLSKADTSPRKNKKVAPYDCRNIEATIRKQFATRLRVKKKEKLVPSNFSEDENEKNQENLDGFSSKAFTCGSCFYRTFQKGNFNRHLQTHIREKSFICKSCSIEFSCKGDLVSHSRTHGVQKPFACTFCPVKLTRRSDLILHIRTHTGEKPFECTYCSSKFARKSDLAYHVRTHTGEKPYSCTMCSARFSRKYSLVLHNRAHTGEKPFHCTYCSVRFAESGTLKRHLLTHTGEKPFKCDSCPAEFARKGDLVGHFRSHNGEKPFVCDFCAASFAQKSSFVRHLKTHSGERPFKCELCSLTYTRKSHLDRHLRKHDSFELNE